MDKLSKKQKAFTARVIHQLLERGKVSGLFFSKLIMELEMSEKEVEQIPGLIINS